MNRLIPALLLILLPLSSPGQAQSVCCRDRLGDVSLNVEVISSGLNRPWGLAFLPDGSQLVTERGGHLRHIQNGRVSRPIRGLPSDLAAIEQGGLLDILVHPDFAQNSLIFSPILSDLAAVMAPPLPGQSWTSQTAVCAICRPFSP